MKHFTSKTVEDAVQAASKAVGIPAEQLIYKVIEEKKGLFGIGKEATIEIYDIDDAAAFAEEYLKTALGGMGVEAETSSNTQTFVPYAVFLLIPQGHHAYDRFLQ